MDYIKKKFNSLVKLLKNTDNDLEKIKVVIIGGGYAGSIVAKNLDLYDGLDITIIEKHDYVHHKIGAIRASVLGGEWLDKIFIPIEKIMSNENKNINGEVVSIDSENKTICISIDKEECTIDWDILVCASGTTNSSPADVPNHITKKEDVVEYFKETVEIIKKSNDIMVVGGGPSSIEYAGEIKDAYPEKNITIVCAGSEILSSNIVPPMNKFLDRIHNKLGDHEINLLLRSRVLYPTRDDMEGKSYFYGENTQLKIKGSNYKHKTDLVLWCGSWKFNNELYPKEWLNPMGELNILHTFQLKKRSDIFAIGDITSLPETKQIITIDSKVKIIVKNILTISNLLRNNENINNVKLKKYCILNSTKMFIPFGKNDGISQVGNRTYDKFWTKRWKSKDVFCDKMWGEITGQKSPHSS